MFATSTDESRGFFIAVWQKMQDSVALEPLEKLVAEIIGAHPEYHRLLDNPDQAMNAGDDGKPNPFLHMGLHIALIEQLQTDRPHGVRQAYQKLMGTVGGDNHEVEHRMMECLAETLWASSRSGGAPDDVAYLSALRSLSE